MTRYYNVFRIHRDRHGEIDETWKVDTLQNVTETAIKYKEARQIVAQRAEAAEELGFKVISLPQAIRKYPALLDVLQVSERGAKVILNTLMQTIDIYTTFFDYEQYEPIPKSNMKGKKKKKQARKRRQNPPPLSA